MEVEDDTQKGSLSSVILESVESAQEEDKLSDDDLAWVNSCLVADTEILEGKWTSFRDVLLEIIGDQPESSDTSATGSDGSVGGTEIKIVPSIQKAEAANYAGRTDDDVVVIPNNGASETNTNDIPIKRKTHLLSQFLQEDSTETSLGYRPFWSTNNEDESEDAANDLGIQMSLSAEGYRPFRSTYNEDESKEAAIDLGLKMSLSADEMISSTADIFKVWDLNIPTEEDDLIKRLNKAFARTETSFQSMPWAFDDSTAWKDSDEPLNTLVAGIADLSLNTKGSS